jgi:hypothetical protein
VVHTGIRTSALERASFIRDGAHARIERLAAIYAEYESLTSEIERYNRNALRGLALLAPHSKDVSGDNRRENNERGNCRDIDT